MTKGHEKFLKVDGPYWTWIVVYNCTCAVKERSRIQKTLLKIVLSVKCTLYINGISFQFDMVWKKRPKRSTASLEKDYHTASPEGDIN